jgi:hypothetical protein
VDCDLGPQANSYREIIQLTFWRKADCIVASGHPYFHSAVAEGIRELPRDAQRTMISARKCRRLKSAGGSCKSRLLQNPHVGSVDMKRNDP